jgi:hypothetical protein
MAWILAMIMRPDFSRIWSEAYGAALSANAKATTDRARIAAASNRAVTGNPFPIKRGAARAVVADGTVG